MGDGFTNEAWQILTSCRSASSGGIGCARGRDGSYEGGDDLHPLYVRTFIAKACLFRRVISRSFLIRVRC